MNKRLRNYLSECKAQPIEPKSFEKYETVMLEETIPQIIANIKQNQESVAELRFSPTAASRSKTKKD